MAGINLDADLGVRGFLKGTKDMEEALQDVSDELENTAKEGDKGLEKLSDKLAEAAKASRNAGDDIQKSLGGGTKRGAKEAEGALDEFKSEANSTAKESAASFDGSAESIVDSFQEIAANAFAGFGPAGAIAGLALAAGIGIGTAAFQQSEEEAKKAKDRIGELGAAMIDAGAEGEVPLDSIIENLKGIVTNSEDAVKQFKDIQKEAKDAGLSAGTLATAYAGGAEALESQISAYDELIELENEAMSRGVENGSRNIQTQSDLVTKYEEQREALKKVQEEQQAAADAEQAWLNSGGAEMLAKAEAIDGINKAYDDVVGSVIDFINEETGVLDVQAYIDAMAARETALSDYQTALAESGLDTEQKSALNDMGVEAASAWMAGYKSATPEQQATMKRFLTEAAKDSSGEAKSVIEAAFKKPVEAKVQAIADISEAEKALQRVIRDRSAQIKINFVDREGRAIG